LFTGRASERGIDLQFKLDQHLPVFVYGDPVRLGQIISNLVGNAIKFTERGSVTLTATGLDNQAGKHHVLFHLRDTGIGIPEDKIDTVFEGFLQASADITRKYGGTGLGLSITRQLLRLMGSDITIKSKPGVGTEFSFDLWLSEAASPEQNALPEKSEALKAGLRVLLVEDNPVNQLVAQNFMASWGIAVTVAEDGRQAMAALEAQRYDLVLMDLHMPVMNGYDAARAIRSKEDAYHREVKIIALTADVSPEIRQTCLEAGINDVLAKPFQPSDLLAMVAKYAPANTGGTSAAHPMYAHLSMYADGNPAVEAELKRLLVKNLLELRTFMERYPTEKESELDALLHKSKTAVSILSEQKLTEGLQQLKESFKKFSQEGIPVSDALIHRLVALIDKLRAELAK
jgi:CheY-like chemotaxis protein